MSKFIAGLDWSIAVLLKRSRRAAGKPQRGPRIKTWLRGPFLFSFPNMRPSLAAAHTFTRVLVGDYCACSHLTLSLHFRHCCRPCQSQLQFRLLAFLDVCANPAILLNRKG